MAASCHTAVAFLLIFCISFSNAGTIKFDKKEIENDETLTLKIGLITAEDSWIGDDDPTLSIQQTLALALKKKDESSMKASVQLLVYHSSFHNCVKNFTCSQNFDEKTQEVWGQLVVEKSCFPHMIYSEDINVNRTIDIKKNIDKSGIYYIEYVICPDSGVEFTTINGTISWKNPFGQLSADLYPYEWFFAFGTVGYMLLGLFWIVLSAIHWKQLLPLQNAIAVVIFLGMVECLTWYFDFFTYNISGNFHWGAIAIGITASTLKRTVSRLLVLVVSMGYGVVKANLGSNTRQIGLLGGAYFIVSLIQQLVLTALREGNTEFLDFIASIIIFPAALLDTVFYWWIFLSLIRTINQLKLRKQPVKLKMYERFFVVLAISGILTCLVILYQTLLVLTSEEDEMWQSWWMFQAFWHNLYFIILVAIAYLWRPTTNNTRYAYIESEDIDLDIELSETLTNRKGGNVDNIDTGKEIHLDLDSFVGSGLIDDAEERREELSKME